MSADEGVHHVFRQLQSQLLLPRYRGVNGHITFFTENLRKRFMTIDANIGALTIKGFFFTRQLDTQSFQLQPPPLAHVDIQMVARH